MNAALFYGGTERSVTCVGIIDMSMYGESVVVLM
jgi:hypothetical protein